MQVQRNVAIAKRNLLNLSAIADCAKATKQVTAEWLGKDKSKLGGKECQQRRVDLIQRVALVGAPLSPEERNTLAWFKVEWDRKCAEDAGNNWPILLMQIIERIFFDS